MYTYDIKIPKERIAVLIGKKGDIKRRLANKLKIKLSIDSNEGLVILDGEDSFNLLIAENVIKAIARGFNPDLAELLLDEDYGLEIIDLTEFSGKSKDKLIRLRSRCIGTEGKARIMLEYLTHTHISVYGKTVSIIGKIEDLFIARESIEGLLRGSKHSNVYARIKKLREAL